jgi:hypothetical protein
VPIIAMRMGYTFIFSVIARSRRRRSNLARLALADRDCFASLAMTFSRHCEEPKATKQSRQVGTYGSGLLRCARNDIRASLRGAGGDDAISTDWHLRIGIASLRSQ